MSFNAAFRALADPTRRDILQLLRDGPLTSGEIADRFPVAWATISRHLAVLRDAKLIQSERQGQLVVYELDTTVFDDVVQHLLSWGAAAPPSGKGARTSQGVRTSRKSREDQP